ncbi:aminomethyl-transferring glycine dehydrogenase subunit GcvPA [Acidobacteriota bacterium]
MSYISLSDKDKKEMLAKIGVSDVEALFSSIPEDIRLNRALQLPEAMTEPELMAHFDSLAHGNKSENYLSFLGAGAYPHIIPSVVDYLSSRGEFVSPYTPYQAEVSQGTLQVIFEFQTLICQLTGMDIANASLYDGASGAAEAVLMSHRLKKKPKILLAGMLHPQYKEVINTYTRNLGLILEDVRYSESGGLDYDDLQERLDDQTSAVVTQSPNFSGVIEDLEKISALAHENNALSVVVVAEPVSLGLLESPGKLGADIVTGEGQSFGLPLSFGGPYLGFMACSKNFIRQFPGRIAGETVDVEGKRGFVLTLSTREQHIRRERATSNICTNQALCALRATIFLETLGHDGLREMAWSNVQKAHYALDACCKVEGVSRKFEGTFFNEFVLSFAKPWESVAAALREKGIIGGLGLGSIFTELDNCALFCVTERHSKGDIDKLAAAIQDAM